MSTNGSKSLHKSVASTVRELPPSGIRRFFDIVNEVEDAISLGVGEPGFPTPWHIRDASVYALEKGATAYTSNWGLEDLRRSIAQYLSRNFELDYDPVDEIVITTGVSEALDLTVRAIVDPGDEILFHEPCYVSYSPVIQLARGKAVAVPTTAREGFKISARAIADRITSKTKALILNYPNNPTGAVLTPEDLASIAEVVLRHDLLVITDEIYAELTYDRTHRSLASLPGMRERTVFLHGFSKAWAMTGFRLGYACAPRELCGAMTKIHQYTMLCAPTLSQLAGIEALKKVDRDVDEMRSRFRSNRNYILSAIREMGLSCPVPEGAFYIFPQVSTLGVSSEEFAIRLLGEEKVAVVPGEAFGPSGAGYIRCSYATSLDSIKTATKRMANFVSRLSGPKK